MHWVRLHHEMPTDPKWRVISRKSGQRIGDVIAVWSMMLVCASESGERGVLDGWDDEVAAAALDIEPEDVTAIREAMQGRVLEGDVLPSFVKRNPKREDDSTERVRKHRERKATQSDSDVTHGNATQRNVTPDKNREDKKREESPPCSPPKGERPKRGTRWENSGIEELPSDWREDAESESVDPDRAFAKFTDYWRAKPGQAGVKVDWHATWRNWCRSEADRQPKPRPAGQSPPDYLAEFERLKQREAQYGGK